MQRGDLAVPVEKLRRVCDPESLRFKSTSEVKPAMEFIGQEKAVEALKFGLEIDSHEHHIFATGPIGTGRKAVLRDFLEKFTEEKSAEGMVELHDICCIHNFQEPDRPKILILEKGGGRKLEKCLDDLLDELRGKISVLPLADKFIKPRDRIINEFNQENDRLKNRLKNEAEQEGFILSETPAGYVLSQKAPASSEEEKRSFKKKRRALEKKLGKLLRDTVHLHAASQINIEKLKNILVADILRLSFKKLDRELGKTCLNCPQLIDYFDGLAEYILDNINLFILDKCEEQSADNLFSPFEVNILVDNSETEKIPIIFEQEPNFVNLFGGIEKRFIRGISSADHTCLKAGSLASANGGYLVLSFWDIIKHLGVWEKLERTLKSQSLEIEEPLKNYLGLISTSLNPEPISIKLKVIVLGSPFFYHFLAEHDPDFLGVFKTKVEFDDEMDLTSENLQSYASFIAYYCQREDSRREKGKLLPFTSAAVAKIAEHGIRLAEKQTKLSTQFDRIKDLVVESDFWASKARCNEVLAGHVKKALEAQRSRLNLTEEKVGEAIQDEMIMIDTQGKKIGQINGLAVYGSQGYSFGKPIRITARTFVGSRGVVSIQREVKMSGPTHDTGVETLKGYFGEEYGKHRPISFSASISFEQCYGGIEGDSASAAELIAIISSLAELPIKQDFAITGSVNQFGEIQPIGGVNEKIEGFFDVCKRRGLDSFHGVVIPHQNIQNLMLREDVVDAVKSGKFAVYFLKTIDDAIELLMGEPPEKVHKQARKRLEDMFVKQKSK